MAVCTVPAAAGQSPATEWSAYGGSSLGAACPPADQIRSDNLDRLTQVWRSRSGDLPTSEWTCHVFVPPPVLV